MKEILLYDVIGDSWYDDESNTSSAKLFMKRLKALEQDSSVDEIVVRVNSPGGYISEGLAIVNAIQNASKPVHCINDGVAYSMGAMIAVAGAKTSAAKNSLYLFHNCWGLAIGNAQDLKAEVENMEKTDDVLAQILADRAGKDKADIMSAYFDYKDHTLTATEAQEQGLINEVLESAQAQFNVAIKDLKSASAKEVFAAYQAQRNQSSKEEASFFNKLAAKVRDMGLNFNEKPKSEKMNFETLSAKLDAAENGQIQLSESEIADLKAEIQASKKDGAVITEKDLENAKEGVKTELTEAHKSELDAKEKELEAAKAEAAQAKKELEDLKNETAGGGNQAPKKEGNDDGGGEGEKSFEAAVKDLPHNKKADNHY